MLDKSARYLVFSSAFGSYQHNWWLWCQYYVVVLICTFLISSLVEKFQMFIGLSDFFFSDLPLLTFFVCCFSLLYWFILYVLRIYFLFWLCGYKSSSPRWKLIFALSLQCLCFREIKIFNALKFLLSLVMVLFITFGSITYLDFVFCKWCAVGNLVFLFFSYMDNHLSQHHLLNVLLLH